MNLPDRVRRGEQLIGSFVMELPARASLEVLGQVGMDFVVLDLEHAPTDLGQLTQLIPIAQRAGLGAIVPVIPFIFTTGTVAIARAVMLAELVCRNTPRQAISATMQATPAIAPIKRPERVLISPDNQTPIIAHLPRPETTSGRAPCARRPPSVRQRPDPGHCDVRERGEIDRLFGIERPLVADIVSVHPSAAGGRRAIAGAR